MCVNARARVCVCTHGRYAPDVATKRCAGMTYGIPDDGKKEEPNENAYNVSLAADRRDPRNR